MYFKIVLFLLFEICTFANSLDFHALKILEDTKNIYTIETLLKNKDLFQKVEKTNIGIKKHIVWTYQKIKNTTDIEQKRILTNPRAGIDFIDVFVFSENKIVKTAFLGDMRPQEQREFVYRKSSFLLNLAPNKEYEIYIKYKSFGSININWEINNSFEYVSLITNESLIFGFIAGFVILICSYILFIDRKFPTVINKIYVGIMICTLLMQFSIAGIFYQMGINTYINTIFSWSVGNFGAALIGFFPIYFFNLKKIMPKVTKVLQVLSYGLVLFAFIFLFYPLKNELLYLAPYANLILFILISFLLYISIQLYLKKVKGSSIYLLANTFFTSSAIYFLFVLLGIVQTGSLFYYSLGIGSILNILCIGMVIVERLLELQTDKEDALILLNEYSKLSTIGQSMINISHQWKEPINQIYCILNNIEAAKEFNDKKLSTILDSSIKDIKNITKYMANTGSNFLELYNDKRKIDKIAIIESLYFSIAILKDEIDKSNIFIDFDIEETCTLLLDKYLISNVFIIVIENSLKIFKQKKIENPKIFIKSSQTKEKIIVNICDNGGGISIFPIESIFEKDLTSRESTGIGLFLAKNILKTKLNGDIKATNTNDGVCFEIVLTI